MAHLNLKTSLIQLNSLLNLNFTRIAISSVNYHGTTTLPANLLFMILNHDGKSNSFLDIPSAGCKYQLLKDHLYFIPYGNELKIDITPASTNLVFQFNFTFFHGIDIFSGSRHCEMRHAPDFIARMHALVNDEKDEVKTICALKAEIMIFCLSVWPEKIAQSLPASLKYKSLFHFVHDSGNAETTVSELAEIIGQRQDVFSRAFRRDIGISPKEFLQRDLLKKITAHLLIPKTSVKETAKELKFSSEFYMSYFFKKRTGISPREYQEKFRRNI